MQKTYKIGYKKGQRLKNEIVFKTGPGTTHRQNLYRFNRKTIRFQYFNNLGSNEIIFRPLNGKTEDQNGAQIFKTKLILNTIFSCNPSRNNMIFHQILHL